MGSKTYRYATVKKKAQVFTLGTSVNSKGKLTFKKLSGNSGREGKINSFLQKCEVSYKAQNRENRALIARFFLFGVSVADGAGVWYTGFKLFVEIYENAIELINRMCSV